MCWRGDPINAEQALAWGLIDRIAADQLHPAAIAFAREIVAQGGKPRPTKIATRRLRLEPSTQLSSRAHARRLPSACAGNWLRSAPSLVSRAQPAFPWRKDWFRKANCWTNVYFQTRAALLIHIFFSERAAAKVPMPKAGPFVVNKAAVAGAGTMGGGIAMTFANAGIPVVLKDVSADALERGLRTIRNNYATSVKRGRFTQEEADQRLAQITPVLSYDAFAGADVIVEAVFEDMRLKKDVFLELEGVAKPAALLTSNTSSLDIDQLAGQTSRRDKVLGLHFFSPANVMRLVEIVRGADTAMKRSALP